MSWRVGEVFFEKSEEQLSKEYFFVLCIFISHPNSVWEHSVSETPFQIFICEVELRFLYVPNVDVGNKMKNRMRLIEEIFSSYKYFLKQNLAKVCLKLFHNLRKVLNIYLSYSHTLFGSIE